MSYGKNLKKSNQALHRTAIPLRSIAAGELRRSTAYFRDMKRRRQ
jgi:hypothetical protein